MDEEAKTIVKLLVEKTEQNKIRWFKSEEGERYRTYLKCGRITVSHDRIHTSRRDYMKGYDSYTLVARNDYGDKLFYVFAGADNKWAECMVEKLYKYVERNFHIGRKPRGFCADINSMLKELTDKGSKID